RGLRRDRRAHVVRVGIAARGAPVGSDPALLPRSRREPDRAQLAGRVGDRPLALSGTAAARRLGPADAGVGTGGALPGAELRVSEAVPASRPLVSPTVARHHALRSPVRAAPAALRAPLR